MLLKTDFELLVLLTQTVTRLTSTKTNVKLNNAIISFKLFYYTGVNVSGRERALRYSKRYTLNARLVNANQKR